MARIAGIDIPKNKRGEIALTYIYGIGRSTAQKILNEAGVDWNAKVTDWNDDQLNKIRGFITDNVKVEGSCLIGTQKNNFLIGYENYEKKGKRITKKIHGIEGTI